MSTTNATNDGGIDRRPVSVRLSERLISRLDTRVEAGDFACRTEAIREATELIVLEKELEARGEL